MAAQAAQARIGIAAGLEKRKQLFPRGRAGRAGFEAVFQPLGAVGQAGKCPRALRAQLVEQHGIQRARAAHGRGGQVVAAGRAGRRQIAAEKGRAHRRGGGPAPPLQRGGVVVALAPDWQGDERAFQPPEGAQVAQGEDVVGLFPGRGARGRKAGRKRLALCGGEAGPPRQRGPERLLKSGRGRIQQRSRGQKGIEVILRAKGEVRDKSQPGEEAHAAQREVLGVAHGEGAGQLQHQVRPGLQRGAGAVGGGMERGHAALGERSAHRADDARAGKLRPDQIKLPPVPTVEGVVFTDDAHDGFHAPAHARKRGFRHAFLGFPPSL